MRSAISEVVVCAESVSDYIALHNLDGQFQRAVDSSNTVNWRKWPEAVDTSLAFGATRPLEYCLSELGYLHCKRQAAKVGAGLADGTIPLQDAIASLKTFVPQTNGNSLHPMIAFADSPPDPTQTLLGNRFLCREGGMLFIGPSGIGKTAASVQQDLLWSIGQPAFGIKPARPLKILTIQAEDDDGDLSEIVSGIKGHLDLTPTQIELSRRNCLYVSEKSLTGVAFLTQVVAPLLVKVGPDILRINPLQAYLGGDIKESELTAAFLRNTLNPLLVTYHCGVILVHHTPKTNFRDTSEWKASDWMYAGAGAADITNWARAALIIDSTDDSKVYRFIAAKRGSRIGWADDNGESVTIRHFSHSGSSSIFWQETQESEIPDQPRNNMGKFHTKFQADDILDFMSAIEAISTDAIRSAVGKETGMSKSTFFRLWETLKKAKKITCQEGKWIRA
jgi:hypothetical protein